MPVVLLLAIIGILVAVFFAAIGRGGELALETVDHAPLDLGPVSPTDVALLRPPTALWGYNMQVTDEALDRIARTLRDRDVEIAYLRRQLADLGHPAEADAEAEVAGGPLPEALPRPDFVPKHERPAGVASSEAASLGAADTATDLEPVQPVEPADAKIAEADTAEEESW